MIPPDALILPNEKSKSIRRRVTGADLAYEQIKSQIISGILRPNEKINEVSLSTDLSISRTPLRHALQKLETEGWISRAQNGRISVLGVSEHELRALYAVRLALEDIALVGASASLAPKKLEDLKYILVQQEQASVMGHSLRATELAEIFHKQIWLASQNRVCQEFLEKIYERTERYRRLAFGDASLLSEGAVQHKRILDLLERGELALARKELRMHIRASCSAAVAAFLNWKSKSTIDSEHDGNGD